MFQPNIGHLGLKGPADVEIVKEIVREAGL